MVYDRMEKNVEAVLLLLLLLLRISHLFHCWRKLYARRYDGYECMYLYSRYWFMFCDGILEFSSIHSL